MSNGNFNHLGSNNSASFCVQAADSSAKRGKKICVSRDTITDSTLHILHIVIAPSNAEYLFSASFFGIYNSSAAAAFPPYSGRPHFPRVLYQLRLETRLPIQE